MSVSNEGKYLEDLTEKYLKTIRDITFAHRRLHDTRAAGRGMIAQPSDFDLCWKGASAHLEVKTTGSKTGLLKTFSQFADLKRWDMASKYGYILVHFHALDRLFLIQTIYLDPAPSWNVLKMPADEVRELKIVNGKITAETGLLSNIYGVEPR